MSLSVIDKRGKRLRVQCSGCGALVVCGKRAAKRGAWCPACRQGAFEDCLDVYRSQVERGVPMNLRYVMVPTNVGFPGLCDDPFIETLRAAVEAIDPPRPQAVPDIKTSRKTLKRA